MRKYHFDLKSVEINSQTLASYDLILIATNHDVFDYDLIQKNSKLIVDTRGIYAAKLPNVMKA
jgi:UDP-N-acetyl-D-glucosamine dehydrogenase